MTADRAVEEDVLARLRRLLDDALEVKLQRPDLVHPVRDCVWYVLWKQDRLIPEDRPLGRHAWALIFCPGRYLIMIVLGEGKSGESRVKLF